MDTEEAADFEFENPEKNPVLFSSSDGSFLDHKATVDVTDLHGVPEPDTFECKQLPDTELGQ